MYYVYFNGDFYYPSDDSHYKHGRAIHTEWDRVDAAATCEQLNNELKDRQYKDALADCIEKFNEQWRKNNN